MVNPNDLVIVNNSQDRSVVAEYLAHKRLIFEYPRRGYGQYDESHIGNIQNGILGELAFLEYVCSYITAEYPNSSTRWAAVKDELGFCYLPVIGLYDEGFEFRFKSIKIDIKTYGTQKVTKQQIFHGLRLAGNPLNLFIDRSQTTNADIFVQAFILTNDDIALAGYNIGKPQLQDWMPNPAYCKPVTELDSMDGFFEVVKSMINS